MSFIVAISLRFLDLERIFRQTFPGNTNVSKRPFLIRKRRYKSTLENARAYAVTIVAERFAIRTKTTLKFYSNIIGMAYRTSFYLRCVINTPVHKGLI